FEDVLARMPRVSWYPMYGQARSDTVDPDNLVGFGARAAVRSLDRWCAAVGPELTARPDRRYTPTGGGAGRATPDVWVGAVPRDGRTGGRGSGTWPTSRSRTTGSSATCGPPPSSASTGRSTGSACRGSTPRAS